MTYVYIHHFVKILLKSKKKKKLRKSYWFPSEDINELTHFSQLVNKGKDQAGILSFPTNHNSGSLTSW